jgi:hypothetical protein
LHHLQRLSERSTDMPIYSASRVLRLAGALAAMSAGLAGAHSLEGRYCRVNAPPGWAIAGEMPTRTSFGADLRRLDGAAIASYFLVGVSAEMRSSPWYGRFYATPEQGVMATLTKMGNEPVQCGAPAAMADNLRVMQCRTPQLTGDVAYQVQPLPGGGYLLAIRTAGAPHAQWPRYRNEAGAVAVALRCNVPFLPSPSDPPGGGGGKGGQGDKSRYNPRTGVEEYCDEKTGQNHDIDPSRQWNPIGPDGPGPYVKYGNEIRKLRPGRC